MRGGGGSGFVLLVPFKTKAVWGLGFRVEVFCYKVWGFWKLSAIGPGDLDGRWVVSRILSEAENKQGRFQG